MQFDQSYEQLLASNSDAEPEVDVDGEDGLLIIYTSGTTGLPKGALISHRAMTYRSLVYSSETEAPKDASFVAWSPLFHMGASDFAHATLMRGGTVHIVDGFDSSALIDIIRSQHIHYLPVVPGMISAFIDALKSTNTEPREIRYIGAMADLVPRAQIAEITQLLNAPYWNTFGSTETGIPPATASFLSIGEVPETLAKTQSSFCEVRLVDEFERDVADGEAGEVLMRGPTLFSGYWNDPTATEQAFAGGWYHMGDVCRRTPAGQLEFVDRRKYLIKSGGENIYPAEIEKVVLSDERIIDAAVVRQASSKWGEVPVLFVASRDPDLDANEVLRRCQMQLAHYKLPKAIYFIHAQEFPRTETGKIERQVLEARCNTLISER